MAHLTNKLFSEAEFLRCNIESHREIVSLLRTLGNKHQQIRILLDNETVIGMSQILEVDPDSDELYLDCLARPEQNQSILTAQHIFFDTALNQVPIIFTANSVFDAAWDERPAFCIDIPERMVRLQRRELFRVTTSGKHALYCIIPMPPKFGRGNCMLPLADISAGGVSLLDDKRLLEPVIGRIYPDCRIDLHEMGMLTVALEVRNAHDVVLSTGKSVRRLGCQFYRLPQAMMDRIERFIIKVERDQNDPKHWHGGLVR